MALGMSYDQYWYGDADWRILKSYLDADRLRQERMNQKAWWFGQYTYDALCVALGNAFRERGKPAERYHQKPYDLGGAAAEETEKEREKREEWEALQAKLYMLNMARVGKAWGKK